jgi:hypothetical protein
VRTNFDSIFEFASLLMRLGVSCGIRGSGQARLARRHEKITMSSSVTLGIHIVDILVYPVTQIPGGQTLAFVEQVSKN